MSDQDKEDFKFVAKIVARLAGVAVVVAGLGMWGCPHYSVWQQGLTGQAEFARAEQNRKILIEQARSRAESAKLDAEAEVSRARGAAAANEIVSGSLGGPEGYLRYLYIKMLDDSAGKGAREVIYVPVDGLLPMTEAGRAVRPKP